MRGPLIACLIPAFMLSVPSVVVPAPPAGTSEEMAEAEAMLAGAGLKTDSGSLLTFFRQRTLTHDQLDKLGTAIQQLGDYSFAVREQASTYLVSAGRLALPFLRSALKDPDPEIARRAEYCLESIEKGPGTALVLAALRLLASRKPSGAAAALLGFLPYAEDDSVEEAAIAALVEMSSRDGKIDAIIVAALTDPEPARRAAAAMVMGQSRDANQRRGAARLLADPAVKVRFQTARALVSGGDKTAVPALLALLTEAPPELAWQVEELLFRLAGETRPETSLENADVEARRKCRRSWESWWQDHEATLDMAQLQPGTRHLGLTVIADLDSGRVVEVGPDHKERWRVDGFQGPVDVQVLPNGHILVAENHGHCVTERDKTGKIVWEKKTSSLPASCQRLPNGSTFIASHNQVLVVARDGKELLSIPRPEGIYSARKLRNGNMVLLTSAGMVVTLDASGKEIRSFPTGGVNGWSNLEVLPDGHCLVCCSTNKIVEFDSAGKAVWECAFANAISASRLPNGKTLVSESEGRRVVEVDRKGWVWWEQKTQGRPWHARRR